jgi:hypothetical protein
VEPEFNLLSFGPNVVKANGLSSGRDKGALAGKCWPVSSSLGMESEPCSRCEFNVNSGHTQEARG